MNRTCRPKTGFIANAPTCAEVSGQLAQAKKNFDEFNDFLSKAVEDPHAINEASLLRTQVESSLSELEKKFDVYQLEIRKKLAEEHNFKYVTRFNSHGIAMAQTSDEKWVFVDKKWTAEELKEHVDVSSSQNEYFDDIRFYAPDEVFWVSIREKWALFGPDAIRDSEFYDYLEELEENSLGFSENTAAPFLVTKDDEYFFVTIDGRQLNDVSYKNAQHFREKRAWVTLEHYKGKENVRVLIDDKGSVVVENKDLDDSMSVYGEYGGFRAGRAAVFVSKQDVFGDDFQEYSFVDSHGKMAGKKFSEMGDNERFDSVTHFSVKEEVAFMRHAGTEKWILVDKDLKQVSATEFTTVLNDKVEVFSEGFAVVSRAADGYFTFVDKYGKEPFQEWTPRDEKGAWKEEIDFQDARPFSEGIAWVKRGSWHAINHAGEELFFSSQADSFEEVSDFSEGRAFVKRGSDAGWALINSYGEKLSEELFAEPVKIEQGVMFNRYLGDEAWYLFDAEGKKIGEKGGVYSASVRPVFNDEGVALVTNISEGSYYIDRNGQRIF